MRLFLIPLLLVLAGCGSTTSVGFLFNPGGATINGVVSAVHVSIIGNADGTKVTVTAVTLVNVGLVSTMNLCGDQSTEFPMNMSVTAVVDPGQTCATLISVRSP